MADSIEAARAKNRAEGDKAVKRSGYARGGRMEGAADDDTKNEPVIKRKHGGKVGGEKPAARADKRARGGGLPEPMEKTTHKASGGSKGKGGVNVNIISPGAAQGEKQQAAKAGLQAGMKMGAASAARQMAGGPPPPGGAPGGPPGPPPPSAPPMGGDPDQPPMKRGGRTGKDC